MFNIKAVRQSKNIKQADLAAMVNVSREHLSAVENNREMPSISLLEKLAVALDVSMKELLERSTTDWAGTDTATEEVNRGKWQNDINPNSSGAMITSGSTIGNYRPRCYWNYPPLSAL